MCSLRERVLGLCVVEGDFNFASGKQANNKFLAERLLLNPELFEEVVIRMGRLAVKSYPDAITYVPTGGRMLAEGAETPAGSGNFVQGVAGRLGLPIIHVVKIKDTKEFALQDEEATEIAEASSRIALFEDAFNTGGSTKKVIDVVGGVESILAVVERGMPGEGVRLPVDPRFLFREPMPTMMSNTELACYRALAERTQKL